MPLSYHPATGGRPAGQYTIVYRFGVPAGRSVQGLTGTVGAPAPAAGSVLTLSPETDAAALWPDLLAIDNGAAGLSFTARSPRRGAVADVAIGSTTFGRSRSSAAAVIADQARVVSHVSGPPPGAGRPGEHRGQHRPPAREPVRAAAVAAGLRVAAHHARLRSTGRSSSRCTPAAG